MAWVLKPLRIERLEDAVSLVNWTSRGTDNEIAIDLPGFLVLSNFWAFSYKHSKIALVDEEPAGIVLGCIDRAQRDSWTFFWGILPAFRKQRLSMGMFAHYFRGLAEDGVRSSSTVVTADGPLDMYQKLGFVIQEELVALEYIERDPPKLRTGLEVSPISAADAARLSHTGQPGSSHWTRRPQFRQRLARQVSNLSISGTGAFLVCHSQADRTLVLDYHLPDPESAAAVTRALFDRGFARPVIFPAAHPDTVSSASLVECGYIVTSRFRTVTLDLTQPNQRLRHLYHSFPDLPLGQERDHP